MLRDITAHGAEMDPISGYSHNTGLLRHDAPVTIGHWARARRPSRR